MEKGKVVLFEKSRSRTERLILTPEEKRRLVDFFSVLIEIDQRNKRFQGIACGKTATLPSESQGLNLPEILMPAESGFSALRKVKESISQRKCKQK